MAIKAARGWEFSADWEREGASWDAITNDMWKAYRNSALVSGHDIFGKDRTTGNGSFISIVNYKGMVMLKIDRSCTTVFDVAVYGLNGKILLKKSNVSVMDGPIMLDHRANGACIVEVRGDKASVVRRMIVVR